VDRQPLVPGGAAGPLRAVLIAFEFPPVATGGVHRALALAEELPDSGIELDVVTVRAQDYADWAPGRLDPSLGVRVSAERVHRIPSGFPPAYWRATASKVGFRLAQYAHLGDPVSLFWRGPLFAELDRIVAERRPHVLLATAPPFGVAVLARAAARRHRIPWVVDWRDPWALWGHVPFASYAHYAYARHQEGRILAEANASVATSHVTREDWLGSQPDLDPDRLVTIYNGFDAGACDSRGRGGDPEPRPSDDGRRRIVYVGSFYYDPRVREAMLRPPWRRAPQQVLFYRPRREDWRYRSPYHFLCGLRRFADRYPDARDRLRVEFAGAVPSWLPSMLEETGTAPLVTLHGLVSHERSLALQRGADAVLLTSARVIGGRDYSIAGKLYEYFGLRRPILGVLTDGAMRDLVSRSGLGMLADPDDPEGIAAQIARVACSPCDALPVTPDDAFLAGFDRRHTAAAMARVLRRAATEGYRG